VLFCFVARIGLQAPGFVTYVRDSSSGASRAPGRLHWYWVNSPLRLKSKFPPRLRSPAVLLLPLNITAAPSPDWVTAHVKPSPGFTFYLSLLSLVLRSIEIKWRMRYCACSPRVRFAPVNSANGQRYVVDDYRFFEAWRRGFDRRKVRALVPHGKGRSRRGGTYGRRCGNYVTGQASTQPTGKTPTVSLLARDPGIEFFESRLIPALA